MSPSEVTRPVLAVSSVARLFRQGLERGGELRLLLLMALTLGPLSACINNTVVVAVFLPVILGICKQKGLSASRFLIPLSFISIFGGICTAFTRTRNRPYRDNTIIGFGMNFGARAYQGKIIAHM